MASIDYVNMAIVERTLEMGSGYVLDFTNEEFKNFIYDNVSINIYDSKYSLNGNSKAKRLKLFMKIEANKIVGNLLLHLLRYKKEVLQAVIDEDFGKCLQLAYQLSGKKILINHLKNN